jgi:chromosome segregation ATPase
VLSFGITTLLDLEESVRQLKSLSEEQKRQIELLEGQKIDLKMDFDGQLFNMQRQYTQDSARQEELRLRQLDSAIEKIAKEREDINARLRQDAQAAGERYKQLGDSLQKLDERLHQTHERSQALDKENASLRAQLQKFQAELA